MVLAAAVEPPFTEDDASVNTALRTAEMFSSVEAAQEAADAELGNGPGEIAAVVVDLSGRGYHWRVCRTVRAANADEWIVSVRTWHGRWLAFSSYEHALTFLRCELAVIGVRDRLIAVAGHAIDDPGGTKLADASQLAAVLGALREEHNLLYPDLI